MKMKTAKIFGILFSVIVLFVSCGQLVENDGTTSVTINLPPVANAGSRAIASGEIPRLQGETVKYRVIFQSSGDSVVREGTGGAFTANFPIGTEISVTVECLNSNGEVIVRTVAKTLKVGAGENSLSFNLKEDGTEIIPESQKGRVIYTLGEAANVGTTSGLPTDDTIYRNGDSFTVNNGSSMTWTHADSFLGWKTNVALTGDTNTSTSNVGVGGDVQLGGTYIMPEGGVVLIAQWQKRTYTIEYNANAPSFNGQTANVVWSGDNPTTTSTNVTALDSVVVFNGTAPTASGVQGKTYTFTGWNTQANGSGTPYSAGQTISQMTGDITLYAQWSDKNVYTVSFSGGSTPTVQGLPNSLSVVDGETSQSWTNPTAAGYTFTGWKVTATDGGADIETTGAITNYVPRQNVTLTAQWQIDYKTDKSTWVVGDIVCENGNALANYNAVKDDSSLSPAVAVVYKKDVNKVYIVGKKREKYLSWCSITASAYYTNVTSLECDPDDGGSSGSYTFTGNQPQGRGQNTDGRGNWQKLQSHLITENLTDDTGDESVYASWYWANNYGTNQNLSGDLASDWYFPTLAELFDIWKERVVVDASLTAISGDTFGSDYYWSSSQFVATDRNSDAYCLDFSSGNKSNSTKSSGQNYVCAVRQFTW